MNNADMANPRSATGVFLHGGVDDFIHGQLEEF